MPRLLAVLALAALPLPALAQPSAIDAQVEALLARMTLEEQVGQLHLGSNGPGFRPDAARAGLVGGLMNFNDAPDVARVQALARESRLGIPLLIGLDILQGFRTIFPVPLAQAATFDPALARQAAYLSAREAAAAGVNWTFAPMADLSRDPRWGRIVEGSGEDPLLNRLFTAARVEGFRAGGLATSLKHYVGYGAVQGGRDYDATEIGPADLRDLHLPAFKAGVAAGAESVMTSLNALDGVPGAVNEALVEGVLRREWGFRGFVVSDWDGVKELMAHGVAADGAEAARKAFLAGVDMDMESGLFARHLPDEIKAGRVPEARLDESVRRILRVKAQMGLFGQPDPDPQAANRAILTPEARAAAREAARRSMVLLRNEGGALPFGPSVRSVALVGGLATAGGDQLGPHAARGWPDESVTILRGLRERAAQGGVALAYAPGCDGECRSADGFAAAVEAARAADVAVAVLGEVRTQSGEAASRVSLDLPGRQAELLDALVATGKPVVVALMGGRPLTLGARLDRLAGLIMVWYPGTEGGPALADVLFGDAEPGGRLPVSWPRTVGQVPIHYSRAPSGRPTQADNRFTLQYMDESLEPLFPFGFGLSYTSFAYSDLRVSPLNGGEGEVEVRARVTNTGRRPGREVAQLYVRDPVATRSRPLRELKAFAAVELAPGETREVTLRAPVRDLGFHLADGTYVVEPGLFEVYVGGDARASLRGEFNLREGLRVPRG